MNLYAYVRNNPFKLIDPDGKDTLVDNKDEEIKQLFTISYLSCGSDITLDYKRSYIQAIGNVAFSIEASGASDGTNNVNADY